MSENEVCAPSIKYNEGSCFTLESLIKITNAYNEHIENRDSNKKIPMIYEKKYLVRELTDRLKNVCDNQLCWLEQSFIKEINDDIIHNNTFRPKGPANSLKWLNTDDINKVVRQYYDIYNNFRFFGAVPIDFDDLPMLGIRDLNFDKLYGKNINELGFVFNLDEHWKSGSHWVALYCNLKKGQIYFFDSYGIKPEKRIRKLMSRVADYCKHKHKKKPDMRYNKIRHQFKNSECGVYSTNFILRLLKGETFDEITKNIVKDDDISKCRKKYFNK